MIDRYTREEMGRIWTEENKFKAWLEVEILACEAWRELGVIPSADVEKIRQHASFDISRIDEIEQETRHDVVAFTRAVSETLGDERKWVHYGLTSTDVVDTALSYLLKQANELLLRDLEHLIAVLRDKALAHQHTVMMGRTHGVHAEPTTFGLKLALWYEEMKRNLERFKRAAENIAFGKLSGAVGTYANIDPFVERYVCEKLGLTPAPVSTQTLQRDRHADYVSTLALIATSIEKFATEIRSLQKTEMREVEEFFAKGQKGSSAMPHKRNPVGSENMTGMARVIRGNMVTAYENVSLWHERDISHSSAERVILPDTTIALDYMLNRFSSIIKHLTVFPENMKRNIDKTHGVIFSQRVLLALIDKGMTREAAYDIVQPKAMQAWETETHFKTLLEQNENITDLLPPEEIDACFVYTYHLKNIDRIFDRIGLKRREEHESGIVV
ncbi:adenylosuccinate lyase [Lentibacillus daqui]|uniref:adenylosuccinate lyase n=1 Tax=Lentibacillus daqui TaxID=2911514 RepID=UPI0022B18580|nr:adenylosuccinate lyase [Lentibacillus daqui]